MFFCVWLPPNNRIAARSGWVPWSCTPRVLFHEILMTCFIVLQISSAGFEYRQVEHLFQRWRFMKTSWPYFFLLDLSWALSSCCSHIQVQRWRCMDENDAQSGFMRRKTSEKNFSSLHLTRWSAHLEPKTGFILALYWTIISSAVLLKSQRLRGIFRRDSCPISRRFELCSRVTIFDILTYPRHIRSLATVQSLGMSKESLYLMFLANYTIGHCLDPKYRAGKWEKVSSAEYRRTLTSCPATSHIGCRVSGGQRKGS